MLMICFLKRPGRPAGNDCVAVSSNGHIAVGVDSVAIASNDHICAADNVAIADLDGGLAVAEPHVDLTTFDAQVADHVPHLLTSERQATAIDGDGLAVDADTVSHAVLRAGPVERIASPRYFWILFLWQTLKILI